MLKNLNDLAKYKGELEEFEDHLRRIKKTYANRPSLLALLDDPGIVS
ncbi:MAG: F0F1 ATP synthase subunit delta [Acidobacteria bacterium]|nr:F0F1 ATP synthase subunit delta [Acidobacteriota bacterium]